MKKDYKKKIIIVEDEIISALYLKNELEKFNFKVIDIVTDGENAINIIKEKNPEIIIMDILLTGSINGIEVSQAIREISNAPIIFTTGYSNEAVIAKIKQISNSAYLEKPINISRVISLISKLQNLD